MKEPGNPGVDRLELLHTFVRIVESGSLSAAAQQLGTTQPTVSRRLQTLERSLGLVLLQRSTHVMKLTPDGERCYGRSQELLRTWHAIDEELRGGKAMPHGMLRVLAPHAFGQEQLVGPLVQYLQRFPDVHIDWLLHDRRPDFIAEGIDCAIQVGIVDDPSVVAIRLGQVQRIVVAAPTIMQGRPELRHAEQLQTLPWLALRTFYRDEVQLERPADGAQCRFAIRPRLSTDSLYALRQAAIAGLGVGLVSAWLMRRDIEQGRLLHLAPDWQGAPLPVYLVYPHARFYPARLRTFLDAIKAVVPALLGDPAAAIGTAG